MFYDALDACAGVPRLLCSCPYRSFARLPLPVSLKRVTCYRQMCAPFMFFSLSEISSAAVAATGNLLPLQQLQAVMIALVKHVSMLLDLSGDAALFSTVLPNLLA